MEKGRELARPRPGFYVKSPVDGRTTPHVHKAAVSARMRLNAREHIGVAHSLHLLVRISPISISYPEGGVKPKNLKKPWEPLVDKRVMQTDEKWCIIGHNIGGNNRLSLSVRCIYCMRTPLESRDLSESLVCLYNTTAN